MVSVLGKVFKDRTTAEISQSKHISMMADGAKDAGGFKNETVFCRYLQQGLYRFSETNFQDFSRTFMDSD